MTTGSQTQQRNETVLITGGAGYIGSWVTHRMLGAGFNVVVLDALRFGPQPLLSFLGHPRYTFMKGDIRNPSDVDRAMQGVDYIAHLAAIVGEAACNQDPDAAKTINLDGTANVVRAAKKHGAKRLVFFSTCSSYGVQDTSVMADETTPVNPVSLYAETKIDGEKLLWSEVAHGDLSAAIFRPSTVHGPSPRMRFDLIVNHFVKDAFLKKELSILGPDMWRPLMWVGEAGQAIELAFTCDRDVMRSQVFNLGGLNGNSTKREIGQILRDKYMPDLKLEFKDTDPDVRSYKVDFRKITERLGFQPSKTLDQALGDLFSLLGQGIVSNPNDPIYRNA